MRLTKTLFKLGLDCPTKLFYATHKDYGNSSGQNSFLMALAKGGFQVEEYARQFYGPGVMIDERNPEIAFDETMSAIESGQTVFEGAFIFENLYVRCDMVRIYENRIDLIEIKAKSFDGASNVQEEMMKKNGEIKKGWKAYLWDVAFQKHVLELLFPEKLVVPYLLMADKTKKADINGLHEKFKVVNGDDMRMAIEVDPNFDIRESGRSLLEMVDVSLALGQIEKGIDKTAEGLIFYDAVKKFSDAVAAHKRFTPILGRQCKACEFNTTKGKIAGKEYRNGFNECWSEKISKKELNSPKPFDIWDNRNADEQIKSQGVLLARDLDDFTSDEISAPISRVERQQLQLNSIKDTGLGLTVFPENLEAELDTLEYPLHFIDFETSTNPLPHFAGQRPYEQVAFQFSHHILTADGQLIHANQFLHTDPGSFPNFEFVRALRKAVGEKGSIFRYSHHENTVLRQIHVQLEESEEGDKRELQAFIDWITEIKDGPVGERNMVDLLPMMKRNYYNPQMEGSNSIKQLLPSAIKGSKWILEALSKPLSENEIHSLNFDNDWVWLENGNTDPYKALPLPFAELESEDISSYFDENEELAEGGAAAMAYGKLQYTTLSDMERKALENALLKYCELDTLAMVISFWHLKELATA